MLHSSKITLISENYVFGTYSKFRLIYLNKNGKHEFIVKNQKINLLRNS
jgi:hypothetical protein